MPVIYSRKRAQRAQRTQKGHGDLVKRTARDIRFRANQGLSPPLVRGTGVYMVKAKPAPVRKSSSWLGYLLALFMLVTVVLGYQLWEVQRQAAARVARPLTCRGLLLAERRLHRGDGRGARDGRRARARAGVLLHLGAHRQGAGRGPQAGRGRAGHPRQEPADREVFGGRLPRSTRASHVRSTPSTPSPTTRS